MTLKKILPIILVIIELFYLFTSSWGYQAFAGVATDKIGFPLEWIPALISAIVILIFIWREKEHPLASFILIGSFLLFLIRAKVFGVSGVDELKAYGDVTVELTSRFWIMFILSIVMFIVDIVFARASNENNASSNQQGPEAN